jgi:hypothetical protein
MRSFVGGDSTFIYKGTAVLPTGGGVTLCGGGRGGKSTGERSFITKIMTKI